jgi:hypothetical protein
MTADFKTMYGWAEIEPRHPVVAGSTGTFTLTYHVGRYGIDDGGTVKIAVRFASDWGYPQCEDPQGPNYFIVKSSGAGQIDYRFDVKGYIRPYQKCLIVNVEEWALSEGDTITVVYGDTSEGSPGTVVQTFREYSFDFKVVVDAFGTGQFVELEDVPELEIVPAQAAKLVVLAPTLVEENEPLWIGVKAEDEWGNPAVSYTGTLTLESSGNLAGLPTSYTFAEADQGVHRFEGVHCAGAGEYRLAVRSEDGLEGESNAIVCVAQTETYRPYWGDLHGQSEETVGTNSVGDYFTFARDVALLDFAGHQGNDFQITAEFWDEIGRCARQFYDPGRFVVFPGYEWSATTPAGGDRNVYYLHDGEQIYRTSHWQVADKTNVANDRYPVEELFAELRQRQALVVPHIGGRPANLQFHDPELEPVIEIYSAWGQFEWLLREAIERGYKVGFTGGSDDHKGRPGASYPGSSSFGVYGGLTCILATELTRQGIWQALKARRCYATTGQRIVLDVRADGHWMGEEYAATGPPRIEVRARGTGPIEEIQICRGLETIYTYPERMQRDRRRLRVVWSGARIKGRARIARWDGELRLEDGKITAAEGYAFDSANEGISAQSATHIAWKSVTSGDEDGVILDIEADAGTKLHFHSPIIDFDLALADLGDQAIVFAAGGVDLQVQVEYLPLGLGDSNCAFAYVDEEPKSGCTPYYVRLTQSDGARAWSSPFYIKYK